MKLLKIADGLYINAEEIMSVNGQLTPNAENKSIFDHTAVVKLSDGTTFVINAPVELVVKRINGEV